MPVTGPTFLALQVRDVEASARFYEEAFGLVRAPQAPPGAVVFATTPVPFAVRAPSEGVDLDAGPAGLGVALWLGTDSIDTLDTHLRAHGAEIAHGPFPTPFGRALVVRDPDGYAIT